MLPLTRSGLVRFFSATLVAVFVIGFWGDQARAENMAFKQAVAEAAALDRDIAEFYRDAGYTPVWTGKSRIDQKRRNALIEALNGASLHGLPSDRYDVAKLMQMLKSVRSPRDLGQAEVALSKAFVGYARDVQTGILTPSKVDDDIKRKVPLRDRKSYLTAFVQSSPSAFIRALPPQSSEYARLMKARLMLEKVIARGGWGSQVPGKKLEQGDSGKSVVALRNRLIAMGYLKRSSARTFDSAMLQAVQKFQTAHGLEPDGVAGGTTLQEINVSADKRLKSVLVAMERERWFNRELGKRHVLVNLTDYSAKIVDNGKVTKHNIK